MVFYMVRVFLYRREIESLFEKKAFRSKRFFVMLLLVVSAALVSSCSMLFTPLPEKSTTAQRLLSFPQKNVPILEPAHIYWNRYQVPFIEASHDSDAALLLGMVHAHLRLGQMEIFRRVAAGRLAEMAGPFFAPDLDRFLRSMRFDRHAEEQLRRMSPDIRVWLKSYVRGINFYISQLRSLPHEFSLLQMKKEIWQERDILAMGRLAGVDVNWFLHLSNIKNLDKPWFANFWKKVVANEGGSDASIETALRRSLIGILFAFNRSGSNSFVISPRKSASPSAIIANDPHVGLTVPGLWLLVGIKSKSMHTVGYMIPGLPFTGLGRNPHLAWGGTNMRALSSDFFDVSCLPPEKIVRRKEKVRVRWWFDKNFTLEETPFGPIISDVELISAPEKSRVALQWVGHYFSDELTSFIRMNQARNSRELREAMRNYAVSGQNILYADNAGNIGHFLAVRLPERGYSSPQTLVLDACDKKNSWKRIVDSSELPFQENPKSGFLASANNVPVNMKPAIGFFFSSNDRISRLKGLLSAKRKLTIQDVMALQLDVYSQDSLLARDALLSIPGTSISLPAKHSDFITQLESWDGHYRAESTGALAFELLLFHFINQQYDEQRSPGIQKYLLNSEHAFSFIVKDIASTSDKNRVRSSFFDALEKAIADHQKFKSWGALHRMSAAHPLAMIPIIGSRYRMLEYPLSGSKTTLMKSSHALTNQRHNSSYGANARHISLMHDINANYFILFGGQDGWLRSENYLDQIDLWRQGRYLQIPLEVAKFQEQAVHMMNFSGQK